MSPKRSGIFLTGATGLVGGCLLRRLTEEEPERAVYVLVRHCSPNIDLPNAHLIPGDITLPALGIPADLYTRLCCSIDTIVHCAAATKFTLPLDVSRQVNVMGAANVLELARRCPHLNMLLHVSSTYIAGRRSGPLPETLMSDPAGWFSPYEQSKFEAEQLLGEQANDVPWVIARLSTIAGNSRSGQVSQFNYFHQLLRLAARNRFPFIPGDPEALVDIVADDWVTDGLLALLRGDVIPRSVLHFCAGPSESLTAHEVVQMAFTLLRTGAAIPSFVSVQEFRAFASELHGKREETLSRMAELLLLYLPHLEARQSFLNSNTNVLLERSGVTRPRTRDFLPRIIERCY